MLCNHWQGAHVGTENLLKLTLSFFLLDSPIDIQNIYTFIYIYTIYTFFSFITSILFTWSIVICLCDPMLAKTPEVRQNMSSAATITRDALSWSGHRFEGRKIGDDKATRETGREPTHRRARERSRTFTSTQRGAPSASIRAIDCRT